MGKTNYQTAYKKGRGYFAGLRMTSRRNNVRNVRYVFLQYLLIKNEKRAKSLHIHP